MPNPSRSDSFVARYGKWALVTGATSGIGAELADQLAAKGLNIILVARTEQDLLSHAALLRDRHGIETKIVSADLTTEGGLDAVRNIDEEIGLLVLSAGIEVNGAFEKTAFDKQLKVLQLNVLSTFQLTHHFSRQMVQRSRGGILLLSSLTGHVPTSYFSNYAGTKAYILNLGASLFGELKSKGVDVTVLSPGLTTTPMVADNGIDWSKTLLKTMDPAYVAAAGIRGLGKRIVTIPGIRNRFLTWIAKHCPIRVGVTINEMMMRHAIDKEKV